MPRKDVNRKEGQTSIQRNLGKNPARAGRPSGGGKHFRDAPTGPSNLERNPGIGSSPGTFQSGESGVAEHDEGPGVIRNTEDGAR
jgi:hypothetical protein